jgi:HK97 gp10 family phage protein
MPQQVEIRGMRELKHALLTVVPRHFQGKVLQAALAAGAKPIVATAQQLAAHRTGTLVRAIYSARDAKGSSYGIESRIVGVRAGRKFQKSGKDAFYWRFIEFGRRAVSAGTTTRISKSGRVRSYGTKAKVLGRPGKGFFGKDVKAARPRPFLRPAFDQNKFNAIRQIQFALEREIPKAARKALWRTPSRRSSRSSALLGA